MAMADRVERLTNLLALLLETNEPLSLVEIAAELAGQYPDQDGARRQAFERDKAALRELGIPIDTEILAGGPYAGQTRYRIDRRKYELADLSLEPDEMHALQVAVAAVRTGSASGQSAIWKLGGALAEEHPPVSALLPDRPELPVLRAAVAARSTITFGYRGDIRRLEPWGLLLRGGFWYVIGNDLDRDGQRTFRVDRFDGGVDGIGVGPADSFVRPPTFDPRAAFPADPKQIGQRPDDAQDARVLVDAVRAPAAVRELGEDRVVATRSDGAVELLVPAANLDAFRSWVLGLLQHAVVLGPPDVRRHVVDWLTGVAEQEPSSPTRSEGSRT
jgi:proteasome accessory factor B